jgi:hypothetical protein
VRLPLLRFVEDLKGGFDQTLKAMIVTMPIKF